MTLHINFSQLEKNLFLIFPFSSNGLTEMSVIISETFYIIYHLF